MALGDHRSGGCTQALLAKLAVVVGFCLLASAVSAQDKCLRPGRLAEIQKQIAAAETPPEDQELHDQLVIANKQFTAALQKATAERLNSKEPRANLDSLKQENTTRICSMLNTKGWPLRSAIGQDGVNALLTLVSKAMPATMQLELYPIVNAAFKKNGIARGELLAAYIDRLRLLIGQKQLFGSQVYVRDGFLVMAPIEQPSRVDQRRTEFGMSPIRSYERFLEISYRRPLIRGVMEPLSELTSTHVSKSSLESPAAVDDANGEEVIKVKTSFVAFDVVIPDAVDPRLSNLQRSDFRLYDDDKPIEIESFTKAEAPFDIVLLLDLSGSTADMIGLIRKTTKRFVAMKRPGDRLAIISFADDQNVVSELESDPRVLEDRIGKLRGGGGSKVWDAIKFSLDMLEERSEKGRRRAIVMMSDGADTNFVSNGSFMGSKTSFADLVEQVQRGTTAIFPIYLDTEGPDPVSKQVYANARLTLNYLADQSAGNMYFAKKLNDLNDIYDRVLKDVGTVYSLGFTAQEPNAGSEWRTLRVEIPSLPGVKIKHRPGYFVR